MQEAVDNDSLWDPSWTQDNVEFESQDGEVPPSLRSSVLGNWGAEQSGLVNPDEITDRMAERTKGMRGNDDDEAVQVISGQKPSGQMPLAYRWQQATFSMREADREYVGKQILCLAMDDLIEEKVSSKGEASTKTPRKQTLTDLVTAFSERTLLEPALDDLMHNARYRKIAQTVAVPTDEEDPHFYERIRAAVPYAILYERLVTEMHGLHNELVEKLNGKPNSLLQAKFKFFAELRPSNNDRTRLETDWLSEEQGMSHVIRENLLKQRAERHSLPGGAQSFTT